VVKNIAPTVPLRLAALFHDIGKPQSFAFDKSGTGHFYGHQQISRDITHEALLRLKSDNRTREQVELLVLHHDAEITPVEKIVRSRLCQFGEATFRDLLALKRADTLGQSAKSSYRLEEFDRVEAVLENVLVGKTCFSLKDLAIRGEDIIASGVPAGPEVGKILREILRQVIDETVPNEKEKLHILATVLHKKSAKMFDIDLKNE